MAKIALVYNLVHSEMLTSGPLDATAELDSPETINLLEDAIKKGGYETIKIEGDENAYEKLKKNKPELVFNISEGIRGESRESIIPAICEHLGIPYTGSGILTTAICLDKPKTKEILLQNGLDTPCYQVFQTPKDKLENLQFPLIAKLAHEGSSMGLSLNSIVKNKHQLKKQLDHLFNTYHEPVLVEEYIYGREFTVGILGYKKLQVLPITEVIFDSPLGINYYDPDDPIIEMVIKETGEKPTINLPKHTSVCPAKIDKNLENKIKETAIKSFRALDCKDWCRMEIRQGKSGKLYVIELNPIAGIDPSYLLAKAGKAAGMSYSQLVNKIINSAFSRYQPT